MAVYLMTIYKRIFFSRTYHGDELFSFLFSKADFTQIEKNNEIFKFSVQEFGLFSKNARNVIKDRFNK